MLIQLTPFSLVCVFKDHCIDLLHACYTHLQITTHASHKYTIANYHGYFYLYITEIISKQIQIATTIPNKYSEYSIICSHQCSQMPGYIWICLLAALHDVLGKGTVHKEKRK